MTRHKFESRDDGLSHCLTCGGAEATLTTVCAGRRIGETVSALVQTGFIDFTDYKLKDEFSGEWVTADWVHYPIPAIQERTRYMRHKEPCPKCKMTRASRTGCSNAECPFS